MLSIQLHDAHRSRPAPPSVSSSKGSRRRAHEKWPIGRVELVAPRRAPPRAHKAGQTGLECRDRGVTTSNAFGQPWWDLRCTVSVRFYVRVDM